MGIVTDKIKVAGGKTNILDFGDRLITTRDLDPTYVGLVGARLGHDQMCRWLLAYWCFYHCGVASYLSEYQGADYWTFMRVAAHNENPDLAPNVVLGNPKGENAGNTSERWPRAAERRHFRGGKCVRAVEGLRELSSGHPEYLVNRLIDNTKTIEGLRTEKAVMNEVQKWPMFGPWIAFKAADMLERCMGVPVQFNPNIGIMYDEPAAGLRLLQETTYYLDECHAPDWWYNHLSMYFHRHLAPPARDRSCGAQEVETVLCKWKSYMGGHYHIGKDIHDHRGALKGWGSTAASMLAAMPEEV